MKRTLLLIAAALILILIGIGAYLYFFSGSPALTVTENTFLPGSGSASPDSGSSRIAQELGVPVTGAGTDVAPRLIRIADRPAVEGVSVRYLPGVVATSTASSASSTTAYLQDPDVSVSYIEKESGNVYDFRVHARTLTRLSNRTLPGIHDATWTPDGETAFVRFLDTSANSESITTFALPRTGEGGSTLERNVSQVLPTGKTSFITLISTTDGSLASVSDLVTAKVSTLFSSQLSRLSLSTGSGATVATTRAAATLSGYSFLVDSKTGSFTRILGPLNGLSATVSPSGKSVLYSYVSSGKLVLSVFNLETRSAIRLPVVTLREKCVWSGDSTHIICAVPTTISGSLPDDWYQGAVRTSDRLWSIDMSSRVATQVVDLDTVGAGAVDAVSLSTDSAADVVTFINRLDGTLWVYDL